MCCAYLCRKLLYYSYFKQATEGDVQVCCGGDAMPSARGVHTLACIIHAAALCVMRTFLGNPMSPAAAPHWIQYGNCCLQGSQPWAVKLEARAKWDAWNEVKGTSAEDAKRQVACSRPRCRRCHDVQKATSPICVAAQRRECGWRVEQHVLILAVRRWQHCLFKSN
jgi:acyl-CoA-binding protein